jgi:hypothetical protein
MNELTAAVQRLNAHIESGTLIRNAWTGTDAEGRATACLLAAMVPQCGESLSSDPCPAGVMPSWLARLTPDLDDRGSLEAWPAMVKRFASLAARWHALDAAAWLRVRFTFLGAVVREAASHTKNPRALAVCERVALLCDGVVTTGIIDAKAFDDAQAAAAAEAEAAGAASWAARAAAEEAAARAAAAEAEAEAAAEEAVASWDRMTATLFDAIEAELTAVSK